MIGDLHLHSAHSDGRLPPQALVDTIADAGVQIAALTDHDTTAGVAEARSRALERGLHFVAGIEMTTYAFGRVIHILGLGVDEIHPTLHAANRVAERVWDANQCRWVEALARSGVGVDIDRDFADHPIRLPVLVERLCKRGMDDGDPVRVHGAFREFFDSLPDEAYEGLPTPGAAGDIIRAAGGIAVVAHPYRLHESDLLTKLLDGADGLEAMYLPYTDAQRDTLRELAERHGKLVSAGSDYHGYFTTDYRRPPWSVSAALLQRLLSAPA